MKYERPLRRPSQMVEGVPPEAPAAQPQTARHGGSAKVLSGHPAAPIGNYKGRLPEAPTAQPQTARHGGSAKALSAYPAAPVGNSKGIPPRSLRRTTANRTARRERESPIGLPCGARRELKRHTPEAPAAQPQTARHGGSVEGSRGAHADGETRHRASSRRLHRTISPWRGAGSRGATVGRPSAHCVPPGRHSEPRPRQPHRPPACAASPSSKAPTA